MPSSKCNLGCGRKTAPSLKQPPQPQKLVSDEEKKFPELLEGNCLHSLPGHQGLGEYHSEGGAFVEKMCCFSPGHDKIPIQVKVIVMNLAEGGIKFRQKEAFPDEQGLGLRRELVEN